MLKGARNDMYMYARHATTMTRRHATRHTGAMTHFIIVDATHIYKHKLINYKGYDTRVRVYTYTTVSAPRYNRQVLSYTYKQHSVDGAMLHNSKYAPARM